MIALATSALASADPDEITRYDLYGAVGGQPGTYRIGGEVFDINLAVQANPVFPLIGVWTETEDVIIPTLALFTTNGTYELHEAGQDTGDLVKVYDNEIANGTVSSSMHWGSSLSEVLDDHGTVIGMEYIVDLGGHDYTLFDTIPAADALSADPFNF